MHADANLLLIYECMRLEEDGQRCVEGYVSVEVYSRGTQQLTKYQIGLLSEALFKMCLTPKHFVRVRQTGESGIQISKPQDLYMYFLVLCRYFALFSGV